MQKVLQVVKDTRTKFPPKKLIDYQLEDIIHSQDYKINPVKIICTLGPSTQSSEMIVKLIDGGMNVARMDADKFPMEVKI